MAENCFYSSRNGFQSQESAFACSMPWPLSRWAEATRPPHGTRPLALSRMNADERPPAARPACDRKAAAGSAAQVRQHQVRVPQCLCTAASYGLAQCCRRMAERIADASEPCVRHWPGRSVPLSATPRGSKQSSSARPSRHLVRSRPPETPYGL